MITRSTAVGVFHDREAAQRAINKLKSVGFTDDQIGVTARSQDGAERDIKQEDSYANEGGIAGLATGAGVGALWGLGIIAGVLPAIGPAIAGGSLAAILSSAAAGAAAAGVAGTLIGLGIPKEEAEFYEQEFKAGRVVVSVHAGDRYGEATDILLENNGYDAIVKTAAAHEAVRDTDREFHVPVHPADVSHQTSPLPAAPDRAAGGIRVPVAEDEVSPAVKRDVV
jgi:hypothetical protein